MVSKAHGKDVLLVGDLFPAQLGLLALLLVCDCIVVADSSRTTNCNTKASNKYGNKQEVVEKACICHLDVHGVEFVIDCDLKHRRALCPRHKKQCRIL